MEGPKIKIESSSEIKIEVDPIDVINDDKIKIENVESCQDPLRIDINLPILTARSIKIEPDNVGLILKPEDVDLTKGDTNKNSTNKFTCDLCSKLFKTKQNLKKHLKNVHKQNKSEAKQVGQKMIPTCEICNKDFKYLYNLRTHVKNVHNIGKDVDKVKEVKRIKCDICCKDVINISMHMKALHECSTNAKCGVCGKEFPTSKAVEGHKLRVHVGQCFKCDKCSESFTTKDTLNKHVRKIHNKENIFYCEPCKKSFMQSQNLKKHVKIVHEGLKEFKCDYCNKRFGYKSHMKDHIVRLHSKEIPIDKLKDFSVRNYPCNICEKIFTNGQHLTRHKGKEHNEITYQSLKYKCKICSKVHFDKRELEVHLCNFHGLSDAFGKSTTLRKCDVCDQKFYHPKMYQKHIKKNHETKCSECHKLFVSKSQVTKHLKKEHGQQKVQKVKNIKLSKCKLCEKSFRFGLARHIKKSHKHNCTHCALAFVNEKELDNHFVEEHVDEKHSKELIKRTQSLITKQESNFPKIQSLNKTTEVKQIPDLLKKECIKSSF